MGSSAKFSLHNTITITLIKHSKLLYIKVVEAAGVELHYVQLIL